MMVSTGGLTKATHDRLDRVAEAQRRRAVATLALQLVGVERTLEHIDAGSGPPAEDLQRAMLATDTGQRWTMPAGTWALSPKGTAALKTPKEVSVHQVITEGGFFTKATRARARAYRERHTAAALSGIVPGTIPTVGATTLADTLQSGERRWTTKAGTIAGTVETGAMLAAEVLIERHASEGTTATANRAQARTRAARTRLAQAEAFQHGGGRGGVPARGEPVGAGTRRVPRAHASPRAG